MRILSVNIGTTNVVFDNNMWSGKEYVYVNGKLVSKKFSWFGTDHLFEVEENGEQAKYILTTGYGWMGITNRLTRNGVIIVDSGSSCAY